MTAITIITAIITSVVTVIISSIFGPWVVWELEKRKLRHQDRRQRIEEWRHFVASLADEHGWVTLERETLRNNIHYLTFREHLNEIDRTNIDETLYPTRNKRNPDGTVIYEEKTPDSRQAVMEKTPNFKSDEQLRTAFILKIAELEKHWTII
jgi:hypothetical protein